MLSAEATIVDVVSENGLSWKQGRQSVAERVNGDVVALLRETHRHLSAKHEIRRVILL